MHDHCTSDTSSQSKECRRCYEIKSVALFYNNRSSSDGKDHYCKSCRNTHNTECKLGIPHVLPPRRAVPRLTEKQVWQNARERFDANPRTEKRCGKCKQVKPVAEFYPNRANPDRLGGKCKMCERETAKGRYHQNPEPRRAHQRYIASLPGFTERQRQYMAEWRRKNPTKAAEYTSRRNARKIENGGSFTPEQFTDLCHFYGNVCLCCMKEKDLIPDHVIPVVKGGSNDISNIQPLCAQCNRRKHVKVIDYRPD